MQEGKIINGKIVRSQTKDCCGGYQAGSGSQYMRRSDTNLFHEPVEDEDTTMVPFSGSRSLCGSEALSEQE